MTIRTFIPRRDAIENGVPWRSGSVTSGNSADSNARSPDSGPERPQPMRFVVHQRHAEPLRQHGDVDGPIGERNAAISLASALGPDLPPGASEQLFGT